MILHKGRSIKITRAAHQIVVVIIIITRVILVAGEAALNIIVKN